MIGSKTNQSEILLESGTNELEIITLFINRLDAKTGKTTRTEYGINAAKVKELVAIPDEITEIPDSPESVQGVFLLRDQTIPLVDLCSWFQYEPDKSPDCLEKWVVIVTEINGKLFGFLSHGVDKVYRVSWTQIQPPPDLIADCKTITGICLVDDLLIQMIDFESITASIDPSMQLRQPEVNPEAIYAADHSGKFVVAADDSRLIMEQIRRTLESAGLHVRSFSDGQAAWDFLCELKEEGQVDSKLLAIVTDIEMPRMDGHNLCMRIRAEEEFDSIPVILFSSLINKALSIKGKEVGADDQITKPELGQLVDRLHACVKKKQG